MTRHTEVPNREQIADRLRQLIDGSLTPDAASVWASPWLTRMDDVKDSKVQAALEALAGADLPSTDRKYLFAQVDFEQWLDDLMA